MREVPLPGADGLRCIPRDHVGVGALVLAGSSGRVDAGRARLLGAHGALTESLRWFGGPGQHDGPWEIAVELFLDRVAGLAAECDRVLVVGTSFGAEAALLTGVLSDEVDCVVAFAPSDVVWAGIAPDGRMTSHWTHRGAPVPFVPFLGDWKPAEDPPSYVDLYRTSRARYAPEVAEATLAVEQIPEVVVVAGGDDRVWPAVQHAELIRDRRAAHGLATTVVSDHEAGHRTILPGESVVTAGQRMQRGGTESADRRLGAAAWEHIAAYLDR